MPVNPDIIFILLYFQKKVYRQSEQVQKYLLLGGKFITRIPATIWRITFLPPKSFLGGSCFCGI